MERIFGIQAWNILFCNKNDWDQQRLRVSNDTGFG